MSRRLRTRSGLIGVGITCLLMVASVDVAVAVNSADPAPGRASSQDQIHRSPAAVGSWLKLASMNQPRYRATATLLQDGRVLVAGGWDGTRTASATAEIFDPTTEAWLVAQPMHQARWDANAVRLRDGRVLVAGGLVAQGAALNESEVFDPATGQWTVSGSLQRGRAGAGITRLPSGQVLIVGGWPDRETTHAGRTAEIFDPIRGEWRLMGLLREPRAEADAVVLPDGKVLVAGGTICCYSARRSSEIFDPDTGLWSGVGPLTQPRSGALTVLTQDGRPFTAGGSPGGGHCCAADTAEAYDPATERWASVASMHRWRAYYGMVVLDRAGILVAGGINARTGHSDASAEVYRPHVDAWRQAPPMPFASAVPLTVRLQSGAVLVAGGISDGSTLAGAALYDPATPERQTYPR